MKDQAVVGQRHVDRAADAALVGGRAVGADAVEMERLFRNDARDALVEHVDCAADRLASVEQDRRPMQHLDPLRRQRIDRHGVVGRSVRNVDRADAVGQDPNALALEAAQHRPRGAGAERSRRDSWQSGKGVADLRPYVADQIGAAEDRGAGENIEVAHEAPGDDDVGPLAFMMVL